MPTTENGNPPRLPTKAYADMAQLFDLNCALETLADTDAQEPNAHRNAGPVILTVNIADTDGIKAFTQAFDDFVSRNCISVASRAQSELSLPVTAAQSHNVKTQRTICIPPPGATLSEPLPDRTITADPERLVVNPTAQVNILILQLKDATENAIRTGLNATAPEGKTLILGSLNEIRAHQSTLSNHIGKSYYSPSECPFGAFYRINPQSSGKSWADETLLLTAERSGRVGYDTDEWELIERRLSMTEYLQRADLNWFLELPPLNSAMPEFEWDWYPRTINLPSLRNYIRVRDYTAEEAGIAARTKGAWQNRKAKLALKPADGNGKIRNLAPINAGQTMMLIAGGQLDNTVIRDPQGNNPPLIIKGQVLKTVTQLEQGNRRVVNTENFSNSIRWMDLNTGDIHQVDEKGNGGLIEFINRNKAALKHKMLELYPPLVNPTDPEYAPIRINIGARIANREPVGKQAADAVTLAAALQQKGRANLLGKQGTGKTFTALMTTAGIGAARILVVTPAHVVTTWINEITECLPEAKVRVCRQALNRSRKPSVDAVYGECDYETALATPASPEAPLFVIVPQASAANGYGMKPNIRHVGPSQPNRLYRRYHYRGQQVVPGSKFELETVQEEGFTCPVCWHLLSADDQFNRQDRKSHDLHCTQCQAALMEPDNRKRSYPLLQYIARRRAKRHDLLIIDETHQYKAADTARGEVIGRCAQKSEKVLALTGTYIGGLVSEAFYLLQRTRPGFSREWPWNNLGQFVEQYGRYRHYYHPKGQKNQNPIRAGKQLATRWNKVRRQEIAGYHPLMLQYLLDSSVFTTMPDLRRDLPDTDIRKLLPPPQVTPVLAPLDTEVRGTDQYSQATWYDALEKAMTGNVKSGLSIGHRYNLGLYRQELLTAPENCWKGTSPVDRRTKETVITLPPLAEDCEYPKEKALVELLQEQKQRERKFLLYCTHTRERDTVSRTQNILRNHGIDALYLDTAKVPPHDRLAWLQENAYGYDGVIVNPNAVASGLNLVEYPTIVWLETDQSLFTSEQASARSDRINQTEPVEVYYLAYAGTLQEKALESMAAKTDAARSLYGDLGKTGLSFMNPMADQFDEILENELYQELAMEDEGVTANAGAAMRATMAQDRAMWLTERFRTEPSADPDPEGGSIVAPDWNETVVIPLRRRSIKPEYGTSPQQGKLAVTQGNGRRSSRMPKGGPVQATLF